MKHTQLTYHLITVIVFICLTGLQGCATRSVSPDTTNHIFGHHDDGSLLSQYAPLIAPQEPEQAYNLIGRATARLNEQGKEDIYIANDLPTYYTQKQYFNGKSGSQYTNLIYRIHFPYVPQPHLTAGKNVGLLLIITLDEQQHPLLVTTVHSCGCYLAMIPTNYLASTAYPSDWNQDDTPQSVYNETLPSRLNYPADFSTDLRPLITLRDGTHRVMDVRLAHTDQITTPVILQPVKSLETLPLGDGYTSFFHETGHLKGYVKGAHKRWEQLLMSWWSFDINIGHDKKLGDPAKTGAVFYTSLKPWARNKSNLWFFADFLDYWGWRL